MEPMNDERAEMVELANLLSEHELLDVRGGTAYQAWCPCLCGEQNEVPGGLRAQARWKGLLHLADVLTRAGYRKVPDGEGVEGEDDCSACGDGWVVDGACWSCEVPANESEEA